MENEHQLSACTFWLWLLLSLCIPSDAAPSLFVFRQQLAGEAMKVAATLTRMSNELPALQIVQINLLREDPWPRPCDVDTEAGSKVACETGAFVEMWTLVSVSLQPNQQSHLWKEKVRPWCTAASYFSGANARVFFFCACWVLISVL